MWYVLWFDHSPAISKRLEKRTMDFVVLLRSDQNPKSGPVRSALRLKADSPRPRKYGGASKIWRYLHIVGRMTAETTRERRRGSRAGEEEGDVSSTSLVYPQQNISDLNQKPYPLWLVLWAEMPNRFCSNETIISYLQVHKAVIMYLPYSMPLSINISPMVRKVKFLLWWLSIVLSGSLPFYTPTSVCMCCSEMLFSSITR